MNPPPAIGPPPRAFKYFVVAAGVLGFFVATTVGLDLLARNQRLEKWVERSDEQLSRQSKGIYSYNEYYTDFEDRLINEELPAADYSKGGVYLFGASNAKCATSLWDLPANEQALIHNYGMASADHTSQFDLVRYLVEKCGLLAAGGEKNMAVFGVSYHSAGGDRDYFRGVWLRHGLFRYDEREGITPVKVNPLWRRLHFEQERIGGCLRTLLHTIPHEMGWRNDPVRKHDPVRYNTLRTKFMGPDWQSRMPAQVSQFKTMVDYLLARKVRVVIVFLPQGSWEDNLPFERAYKEQVTQAFQGSPVTVLDWSKRLDDDDFADSGHANPKGTDKLQAWFMEIALPFLRSTHALPQG